MATWQDAVKKAVSTAHYPVGRCDNFVARMWGQSMSGYNTAVDNWNASPDKHKSGIAPAGALYYWGGGAGHVAISLGDGTVMSTDYPHSGTVGRVSVNKLTKEWNKPYLGWAPAYFNGKSMGKMGPTKGASTNASDASWTGDIGGWLGDIWKSGKDLGGDIIGGIESGAGDLVNGLLSFPKEIVGFFGDATDAITEVMSVFKAFFDPATYVRIGAGFFGMIFLFAALIFMMREAV